MRLRGTWGIAPRGDIQASTRERESLEDESAACQSPTRVRENRTERVTGHDEAQTGYYIQIHATIKQIRGRTGDNIAAEEIWKRRLKRLTAGGQLIEVKHERRKEREGEE